MRAGVAGAGAVTLYVWNTIGRGEEEWRVLGWRGAAHRGVAVDGLEVGRDVGRVGTGGRGDGPREPHATTARALPAHTPPVCVAYKSFCLVRGGGCRSGGLGGRRYSWPLVLGIWRKRWCQAALRTEEADPSTTRSWQGEMVDANTCRTHAGPHTAGRTMMVSNGRFAARLSHEHWLKREADRRAALHRRLSYQGGRGQEGGAGPGHGHGGEGGRGPRQAAGGVGGGGAAGPHLHVDKENPVSCLLGRGRERHGSSDPHPPPSHRPGAAPIIPRLHAGASHVYTLCYR